MRSIAEEKFPATKRLRENIVYKNENLQYAVQYSGVLF